MSDYRIEIRIKNARILRLMKDAGFFTVAALCQAMGCPSRQSMVGELINLKRSPLNRHGDWLPIVYRVADALNAPPDDLFSDAQRTSIMQSNRAVVEATEAEVGAFLERRQGEAMPPDEIVAAHERDALILKALGNLRPREREIIIGRFGLYGIEPQTYERLGAAFGVQRERIRQIEAKALRSLRLSPNTRFLADFAVGGNA